MGYFGSQFPGDFRQLQVCFFLLFPFSFYLLALFFFLLILTIMEILNFSLLFKFPEAPGHALAHSDILNSLLFPISRCGLGSLQTWTRRSSLDGSQRSSVSSGRRVLKSHCKNTNFLERWRKEEASKQFLISFFFTDKQHFANLTCAAEHVDFERN